MDKGEFIGRAALEGRSEATAARRLVVPRARRPATVLMGKEPVVIDGRTVGYVTSAAFGYSVGRSIAYAWVPAAAAARRARRSRSSRSATPLAATVADEPLFDPGMDPAARLRPHGFLRRIERTYAERSRALTNLSQCLDARPCGLSNANDGRSIPGGPGRVARAVP